MRVIPPKDVFSRKGWYSILACFLTATLLWASHFWLEFSILIDLDLNLWIVGLSYIGCIFGGILALTLCQKLSHYRAYFLFFGLFTLFQIILKIVDIPWIIYLLLFGIGLTGGGFAGVMFAQLSPAFPDPKYNGRVNGLGYMAMNLVILLIILLDLFVSNIPILLLIGGLTSGVIFLSIGGKSDANLPQQRPLKFKLFFSSVQTGNKLVIAFFWGFFLTIPFYAALNLIIHQVFSWDLNRFMIIIFITITLLSVPNGLLLDKLGRKPVMLLGIGTLSMAFFVLFLPITETILEFVFPFILGIGTTLFLTSNSLIFIEFTEKKYMRYYMTLYYIFTALGMFGGVVMGVALESLYLLDPIYLTVVLLFLFLIATIIISQTQETLPKKEELEWKNSIQRVYLMYKSGIPIYSQEIKYGGDSTSNIRENTTEELLSGTLVTVSSILDEISKSQKPLKVIKREELSILIEDYQNVLMVVFTSQELSKIREKMLLFLQEFNDFFEDALRLQVTDQTVFYPTKKLIQKHFFYYW